MTPPVSPEEREDVEDEISAWRGSGVNPEINPPPHASGLQKGAATPDKAERLGPSATLQSCTDDPAQGPLRHQPFRLSIKSRNRYPRTE
jgi:hypothetical protein